MAVARLETAVLKFHFTVEFHMTAVSLDCNKQSPYTTSLSVELSSFLSEMRLIVLVDALRKKSLDVNKLALIPRAFRQY